MEKIKIPSQIILKLKNAAPTYVVSENYGRRIGHYGDSDESASGYKSICIYVQNGLAEYIDLFKEIARGIFRIQIENQRKYPLIVFGFGKSSYLQHENKHFDFGFLNDSQNVIQISEAISSISGYTLSNPAIINELFPQTDIRSVYYGKIKIEIDDLLIIIGRKDEVYFNINLKNKIDSRIRRHILLVEIEETNVNYLLNPSELKFQ